MMFQAKMNPRPVKQENVTPAGDTQFAEPVPTIRQDIDHDAR